MITIPGTDIIDWTGCPLVEINPRKVSGVPILKGTRVQADAIVENFEDGSPVEEIAENFAISEAVILELMAYATGKQMHPPNEGFIRPLCSTQATPFPPSI